MHKKSFFLLMLAGMLGSITAPSLGWAEGPEVSITAMPVRYIFVDGDDKKFREHHWRDTRWDGGIKEMSLHQELGEDTSLSMEGHALVNQNDFGAELSLKREDVYHILLEYTEFRKYYDTTGGRNFRFTTLDTNDTQKELALDIGRLEVETELALGDYPDLTLAYEREFKDGAKSRLTWTSVKEVAETRKIGPAWQEMDEIVDVFMLKAGQEVAGFHVSGEQRWEFVQVETLREEKNLATTGVASDTSIRRQEQNPESSLVTSLFNMERPFWDDKIFVSSGYRFAHLNNREYENLLTYNSADGSRRTDSHNRINAYGSNDYDSHTWVGNFNATPFQSLSVGAKLKAEHVKTEGNSVYPEDSDNNAIVDRTSKSNVDNQQDRLGESLAVRFFGVPRTALYAELEMEQSRVLMREDRQSIAGESTSSDGEIFNRRTITDVRRGAGTLGARLNPVRFIDITTHLRHRKNNNDYDDQQESDPGSSTARSAFMDEQNIETDEVAARITFKALEKIIPPLRRVQAFIPSLRYQYRDDDYFTRVEAQSPVETNATSYIYTAELTVQPMETLLITGSFSRTDAKTETTNTRTSAIATPTFNADVDTWLASTGYTLRPDLHLTTTFMYSRADNFNNFADVGEPHGVDNERVDASLGIQWTIDETTSLEADYAYYHYSSNPLAEVGDYNAQVVWLEFSKAL